MKVTELRIEESKMNKGYKILSATTEDGETYIIAGNPNDGMTVHPLHDAWDAYSTPKEHIERNKVLSCQPEEEKTDVKERVFETYPIHFESPFDRVRRRMEFDNFEGLDESEFKKYGRDLDTTLKNVAQFPEATRIVREVLHALEEASAKKFIRDWDPDWHPTKPQLTMQRIRTQILTKTIFDLTILQLMECKKVLATEKRKISERELNFEVVSEEKVDVNVMLDFVNELIAEKRKSNGTAE